MYIINIVFFEKAFVALSLSVYWEIADFSFSQFSLLPEHVRNQHFIEKTWPEKAWTPAGVDLKWYSNVHKCTLSPYSLHRCVFRWTAMVSSMLSDNHPINHCHSTLLKAQMKKRRSTLSSNTNNPIDTGCQSSQWPTHRTLHNLKLKHIQWPQKSAQIFSMLVIHDILWDQNDSCNNGKTSIKP